MMMFPGPRYPSTTYSSLPLMQSSLLCDAVEEIQQKGRAAKRRKRQSANQDVHAALGASLVVVVVAKIVIVFIVRMMPMPPTAHFTMQVDAFVFLVLM